MDELLSEADVRGFRQMIAVIGDSQQVASIALHRAAGFNVVGTLRAVGFKFDRWLDTVLMQRPLGPGARTLP
jgi:phosphinothricin acetyltransferase